MILILRLGVILRLVIIFMLGAVLGLNIEPKLSLILSVCWHLFFLLKPLKSFKHFKYLNQQGSCTSFMFLFCNIIEISLNCVMSVSLLVLVLKSKLMYLYSRSSNTSYRAMSPQHKQTNKHHTCTSCDYTTNSAVSVKKHSAIHTEAKEHVKGEEDNNLGVDCLPPTPTPKLD